MSKTEIYISGSCAIENGALYLDMKKVLQYEDTAFEFVIPALVKDFQVSHPRFGKMDKLSKLGYTTVEILISRHPVKDYADNAVGLLLSNNSSCLETDFEFQKSCSSIPSPSLFVYTVPNIVLAEICIKNKIKGENMFFISDVFNTSELYRLLLEMFENGRVEACIAGWTEVFNGKYQSIAIMLEKSRTSENAMLLSMENLEKYFNKS